jgi:hypothetical protein
MSETIVEMARREAEEAEREAFERMEVDAEADAETEADAEEAPYLGPESDVDPEPPSDKAIERALTMIEKAGDAYVKKVTTIQARTDLGLVECPLCPVPGFVSDPAPPEFDPAQLDAVRNYLGLDAPPAYQANQNYSACATCDGWGMVATGSKRPGYTDAECPDCLGKGYRDTRFDQALADTRSPLAPGAFPPPAFMPPDQPTGLKPSRIFQGGIEFELIPGGAPDQHGRLAGHPMWGMPIEQGGL